MKFVIVIPAYQPRVELVDTVKFLVLNGANRIIIVNDGSSAKFNYLFEELSLLKEVDVLSHAVNLGKGQALKTAFNHYLIYYSSHNGGVVTADADGQHHPDDIIAVGRQLTTNSEALILGRRTFRKNIPFRSYLGNQITKWIFRILLGKPISDTQTGLRGIPNSFLPSLMTVRQSGYEFELEMLVQAVRNKLPIMEVPIQTIYIESNASSHFDPLFDSLRIYFVFLRFSALSISTALLDYCVFFMAYSSGFGLLMSSVIARLFAGTYNFSMAKTFVFHSKKQIFPEAIKYASLVSVLLLISYVLVHTLHDKLGLNVFLSKGLVESGLFFCSFSVQNLLVFISADKDPGKVGKDSTDWDMYYRSPLLQAQLARRITLKLLTSILSRYVDNDEIESICELGGANSCLYESLKNTYPNAQYTIVDNNRYGIELTRERFASHKGLSVQCQDILDSFHPPQADLVISLGLIEHFDQEETKRAIEEHFKAVKPGGLVLITYPTPTWLYCVVRGLSEFLGLWIFHDERPLLFPEVRRTLLQHGKIIHYSINWWIFLTQGIVLVRANK